MTELVLYELLTSSFNILVTAFAVYGISLLIAEYDGAFNSLKWLRENTFIPDCGVCVGFWLAIIAGVAINAGFWGTLAILGIVIFLVRKS